MENLQSVMTNDHMLPRSFVYSHLFNSRGGCNKCGGGAKFPELINKEVGINVEEGIFWRKKLVHKCNKRGV